MRDLGFVLIALLLAGCAGTATASPTASPTTSASSTLSPVATTTPVPASPTPARSGIAIEQRCSVTPALDGRPVALGSLTPNDFNPPNVLLDLTNPSVPTQLCTYRGLPWRVRFISSTQFAYSAPVGADGNPSDGVIGTFDIQAAINQTVMQWHNGGFGAGTFAWSGNGALAYILAAAPGTTFGGSESWEVHLVKQGQDHTVATLPGVPARGAGGDDDDIFLAFSPDGQYLALEETFTNYPNQQGFFQVWRVSDASPLTPPMRGATMAVWAQNSLFYRDQAGVHRWDVGGTTTLLLPGVSWIGPRASPDGKWVTFSLRDSTGLVHVNVLNVSAGSSVPVSSGGRDGAIFVTQTILWDNEQRLCGANDPCGMSRTLPTGLSFFYDVTTRQEYRSGITAVADVWPRMD